MSLFEYFSGAGTATNAGIFIPVSDLPGAVGTELEVGDSAAAKEGQALFSFLKQLIKKVTGTSFLTTQTDTNLLGLTYTLNEAIPLVGLKNKSYIFTFSKVLDTIADMCEVLPVASAGTYSGKGDITLTDIFPNCAKVAASGAVSGAGILVISSVINTNGGDTHANVSLTTDCRRWVEAFMGSVYRGEVTVRATGIESAITAVTKSFTSATIPSAAYAATNPITGISSSDSNKLELVNITYGVTIQLIENENETISVNVA